VQSKHFILLGFIFTFCFTGFAQKPETEKDSVLNRNDDLKVVTNNTQKREIDPLAPSRAAFYSAVLPGLGQAYNKKYWKIPIVLGAITGGIMVYDFNNKEYKRFRDAYKSRLAGFDTDEFQDLVTTDGLLEAQRRLRRRKELTLLVTVGIYALNIIDANVDAHLAQYNIDDNLSLRPHFKYNEFEDASDLGLTLNFKF